MIFFFFGCLRLASFSTAVNSVDCGFGFLTTTQPRQIPHKPRILTLCLLFINSPIRKKLEIMIVNAKWFLYHWSDYFVKDFVLIQTFNEFLELSLLSTLCTREVMRLVRACEVKQLGLEFGIRLQWGIFQVHKNIFQKRNENAAQDVKSHSC